MHAGRNVLRRLKRLETVQETEHSVWSMDAKIAATATIDHKVFIYAALCYVRADARILLFWTKFVPDFVSQLWRKL